MSSPTNSTESLLAKASELIDAGRYLEAEQVLREALQMEPEAVEGYFLLGLVLAKQEKWLVSRESLERVITLDPQHGRAYTELAGIEFKLGNRTEATRNLRQAEKLSSDTEYVRTFLATLLYLENRKTEALYYWNKAGAPRVDQISYNTSATVAPELLQRLFPLNEGEVFRRKQMLDIRWKQERFRLGSPFSWQLTPRGIDIYELNIALASGSNVSSLKLVLLENAVSAPLYREVSIEYPMTLRSGKRIAGRFRWDEPRKRVQVSAWLPFVSSSSDGLGLGLDLRDEHWSDRLSGTEFLFEARKTLASYELLFEGRKSLALRGGYENQKLFLPEPSNLPEDSHFAILGTGWNQGVGLNASDDFQLQIAADLDGFFGYGAEGSR
ncbi:MAG TPA: tetratricopeptide repeat protein, partial [Acidobacteriota bacterium]|nr:tetratricopeptide repeat protein [Acidobacteriota bacterium]